MKTKAISFKDSIKGIRIPLPRQTGGYMRDRSKTSFRNRKHKGLSQDGE